MLLSVSMVAKQLLKLVFIGQQSCQYSYDKWKLKKFYTNFLSQSWKKSGFFHKVIILIQILGGKFCEV